MTNTALILIDVQNDFLPGGALAVVEGDAILGPASELAEMFGIVVLTQDWHPAGHKSFASSHEGAAPFSVTEMPYGPQVLWPDHCVQGTPGADFRLPAGVADKAALIIRKGMNPDIDSYSAFTENDKLTPTGLAGWLRERGVQRVVLAGLALDYCVAYSALDATSAGFEVDVVLEACRAIGEDTAAAQISAMERAGVRVVSAVSDLADDQNGPRP